MPDADILPISPVSDSASDIVRATSTVGVDKLSADVPAHMAELTVAFRDAKTREERAVARKRMNALLRFLDAVQPKGKEKDPYTIGAAPMPMYGGMGQYDGEAPDGDRGMGGDQLEEV